MANNTNPTPQVAAPPFIWTPGGSVVQGQQKPCRCDRAREQRAGRWAGGLAAGQQMSDLASGLMAGQPARPASG